jgi:hypothetical protein
VYLCDLHVEVLEFGALINSKIWASQAKNSQAKPSAWEAAQATHVTLWVRRLGLL